jgi:hypothetical protein
MHGSALAAPVDETPSHQPGVLPDRHRHRRWWWLAAAGAAVVGFVLVSLLPWEWSFIDDGQLIGNLHAATHHYGTPAGIAVTVYHAYQFDAWWGLFRPAYWLWQAVFYLLPVGPAHAVRVAMLGCAVAGPVVALGRRWTGRYRRAAMAWCAAAVLVDGGIWFGLWYPSLQELDGLAFVGLGLAAGRRHPWLRLAGFLTAAWFKAPFGWLLLSYGVLLLVVERRWRYGVPATVLGAGTVATATLMARSGSYTGEMVFTAGHLLSSAMGLAYAAGPAALVVLVGALGLGVQLRRDARDAVPLALLLGGLGYAANLLPWHVGGYYPAPAVYLATVGTALLLTASPVPAARARTATVVTLVSTAVLAAVLLVSPLEQGVGTVVDTVQLRDCVLRLPPGAVIGFNAGEGDLRLAQIVTMHDPSWHGRITWVDVDHPSPYLQYYVNPQGSAAPAKLLGTPVCDTHSYVVHAVTR